jgi:hypothetical protein
MSLTTQFISGSVSAINLIKNYLDNPSIAPQDIFSTLPFQNPLKTVPLQCETYKEVLPSDVSQQLIIDSSKGKKLYVTDNIAPKPRTWEIKGYIGAAPYELIASPILQLTQAKKLSYLREMRDSREMLVFRTKNGGELVFVAIKNLEIDSRPEVQNRIPISMTIQEIPILAYTETGLGIPFGSANPAAVGDKLGQVLATSLTVATIAAAVAVPVGEGIETSDDETKVNASLNVPNNRTTKKYYQIDLPETTPGYSFSFIAKVEGKSYNFAFRYTNVWNVTTTFPDGSTRLASLIPNTMNWSGYSDFGLVANTPLDTIGFGDLQNVTMYMVSWE